MGEVIVGSEKETHQCLPLAHSDTGIHNPAFVTAVGISETARSAGWGNTGDRNTRPGEDERGCTMRRRPG